MKTWQIGFMVYYAYYKGGDVMIVVATGVKFGNKIKVKYEGQQFFFNDSMDMTYEAEIRELMKETFPVGGTYHPSEDSILNIANVLQNHFFDSPTMDVTIKGDFEPLPFEENVIY